MALNLNSSFLNVGTNFGLDMIRQSPPNIQLVVSPLSVILALAMVQAGARGKTKTQINEAISDGRSASNCCPLLPIIDYYSGLSNNVLTAAEGVQTKIANAFYLDKRYSIEKDYADKIMKEYSAKVETLDFEEADDAAKIIDKFVSDTTEGKIKNFINEKAMKDGFFILFSRWLNYFEKSSTENLTFYMSEDKTREFYINDSQTLHLESLRKCTKPFQIEFIREYRKNRSYAEDEDMQVLSLPYKDTSYSFNILLPKER
ncbi:serine proteinase inhibitor [Oesophagostomum dentatum]|uniref:Serine proteinase inhibitor n=1 Tax=Oesophagostomum dentatum TaxID=61180 RepID=A0A0B1SNB6_OESDE|nr:serine proteinase inhibitor [Oesophagostomum dentatum]